MGAAAYFDPPGSKLIPFAILVHTHPGGPQGLRQLQPPAPGGGARAHPTRDHGQLRHAGGRGVKGADSEEAAEPEEERGACGLRHRTDAGGGLNTLSAEVQLTSLRASGLMTSLAFIWICCSLSVGWICRLDMFNVGRIYLP